MNNRINNMARLHGLDNRDYIGGGETPLHEKKGLTYRLATIHDIEELAKTRVAFFAEVHSDTDEQQKSNLYIFNKEYFSDALADGTFAAYLVFNGTELAATSGISYYKTTPTLKNPTGKMAYISNMYTKPEYRGRGIATRLFEMSVAHAKERGCRKITLNATEMGRPIYEKYGFKTSTMTMEYYIE